MKTKTLFIAISFIFTMSLLIHCSKPETVMSDLATGYVQVKQIDGVWWFIGPDGDKFVSLGVNHIEPHLWLAPYNKEATLARYGDDMISPEGRFVAESAAAKKWIDHMVEICEDLHFNTFGKHTHPLIDPALYKDQVYYIASLETAPLSGWRKRRGEGPMPDVFSTDFKEHVSKTVQNVCSQHKDSRNLLGYVYTDVPNWKLGAVEQKKQNEYIMIYPWINTILKLGTDSPGKHKWIEHLQSRYSSPEAAAKVWGLCISPAYGISWNEMVRYVTWFEPTDSAKAQGDMISFLSIVVEQWYGLHHDLVRKYDPNHLILGDKNMVMWFYDWMVPAIKKYVDVVTIQAYGRWSVDGKTTDTLYEQIGKPIYNGDGSYSITRPTQKKWGVKGWRTHARNIEEVASFYQETLEGMMAKPYMIGWHHCGSMEQWDDAERGDSPMNENGFMDPFEKYYKPWTDVIRKTNLNAFRIHNAAR